MLGKLESIIYENCQLFNMEKKKRNLITLYCYESPTKRKKNIVEEKGAEQQRDFSPWQKFFLVLISFSSLIITEKTFVSLTEGLGNGTSVLLKQD